MRRMYITRLVLAFACSALSISIAAQELPVDSSRPLIAAHRGGAMHRPENTLSAFHHAVELGVEVLEFDMVMTADDQLVVHHDARINAELCIPDANSGLEPGPIRALSYEQTQQFDCGAKVREIYDVPGHVSDPGARIPTVDAVLAALRESNVEVFAETKVPQPMPGVEDVDPFAFARAIDALVRKHGLEERFILQSSDYRTIDALHEINPRLRTCLLNAHNWGHRNFLEALRQHHASCILLRASVATKEDIEQLQAAGIQVYSEVIDTPADWQTYLGLGVDVLFTNDPGGLLKFLSESNTRN